MRSLTSGPGGKERNTDWIRGIIGITLGFSLNCFVKIEKGAPMKQELVENGLLNMKRILLVCMTY